MPDRQLIAPDAGGHGQQRDHHTDPHRRRQATARVSQGDEGPERDQPSAHAVELEAVRAIGQDVAHRGAVLQHRPHVQQVAGHGGRLHRAQGAGHAQHQQWPQAGQGKCPAPAPQVGRPLRHQERQAHAQRKGGGVQRHRARGVLAIQPVGQRAQAGHVGPGKARARQAPPQHGRAQPLGQQRKAEGGQCAEQRTQPQDAARVMAVGQGRQDRHRHHVAASIGRRHQPGLGIAQPPGRDQVAGHHRGHHHMGQQAAQLPQAHQQQQRANAHGADGNG